MTKIPTRDVQIGEIVDDAIARILALTGEHAENVPDHDPNHEREEVVGSRDVPNNRQSIAPEQTRSVPAPPSAPATAEVRDIIYRLEKVAESFERPPSVQSMANIRTIDTANDAIKMLTSLTALAGAASFRDSVEAIEAARDRYVAAVDPDPHARTAWQSGAIEDGFRLSLAALRALTPPAASQDSGASFPKCRKSARDVREIIAEMTDVRERALLIEPNNIKGPAVDAWNDRKEDNTDEHARQVADGLRTPDIAAIGKNNRERQEELETFFPAATKGGPSADEIAEWRRLSDDASEDLSQSGASIPGAVERFNHAAIVNFMWIVECVVAERERAEKAEREMTRAIEERDHWYRQAVGDEAAMRERALQTQVTRLTEDLAARTKERDDLSAQVYVPGQWVCAKCKFTLQQMVMSAVDGSVTAQDKPGEPCPNCASPLWRTTWKQEASEMQERAIEQMERERDEARKHAANTRIRERVEGDNLRSRIDQEAARADALQQRVGALEAWIKELREAGESFVIAVGIGWDLDGVRARWDAAQTPTPDAKTEGV